MTDKIVRFPVKTMQRIRNRRGKRSVSCMVSDRWLRFPETAAMVDFGDGRPGTTVIVDVMTDAGDDPKKLCELCIRIEDLEKAISNIRIAHDKH